MSDMGEIISIGEALKRVSNTDTAAGFGNGADDCGDRQREAREYLERLGIEPEGKRIPVMDVLAAKRQEARCSECAGLMDGCQRGGYPASVTELNGKIVLYAVPCRFKAAFDRQAEMERLMGALPEKLRSCSFENFVTADMPQSVGEALNKARAASVTGESVVLAGDVGTGKTHLAAAIVINAIREGKRGIFASVPKLMNRLKSFGPHGDYESVLRAVAHCDVLALDDMGAERYTGWVSEQLYLLVDERYLSRRQTVVTSNYPTPRELAAKMDSGEKEIYGSYGDAAAKYAGQRIVSRLREMGPWVAISGVDQRMAKAARRAQKAGAGA